MIFSYFDVFPYRALVFCENKSKFSEQLLSVLFSFDEFLFKQITDKKEIRDYLTEILCILITMF